jgi:rubrerythrin
MKTDEFERRKRVVLMQELEPNLAVLRHAIQNEVAGQRFYDDAAFYCIDPRAKETFAALARDEEEHTHLLLAEYQALSTKQQWLRREVAMARGQDVDITQFVFTDDESVEQLFPPQWSTGEAIDRRSDDLAALVFGIKIEMRAIALYRGQAEATEDSDAQEAYGFLVQEETRHYDQLRSEWERLAGMPWMEL